jgi:predicted RNase H-like HicB family nuclease
MKGSPVQVRASALKRSHGLSTFTDMSNALHLTIRYEDAGDGWLTAQVAEVPGAISQGKTREEARANVIDALDVLLTPDEELAGGAPAEGSESVTLSKSLREATGS